MKRAPFDVRIGLYHGRCFMLAEWLEPQADKIEAGFCATLADFAAHADPRQHRRKVDRLVDILSDPRNESVRKA